MSGERSVLITGASGFLGRHAVAEFATNGDEVIATGRNVEALHRLAEVDGVTTVTADLASLSLMRMNADVVVHAAALSSPWGRWRDFEKHNVAGTQAMIDFVERNHVRRLVFVSSPSMYSERRHRLDVREDEVDPNNRMSSYIRSKILAEQLLQRAHAEGRIPELVILRPRGLIGAGDPSLMPRLVAASRRRGIPLFNDGTNIVDVTCVENGALALRLAADAVRADGVVYNITNGEPMAFRELLDRFFSAMGEEPHYITVNLRVLETVAATLERIYAHLPPSTEPPFTRYTVATLAYAQTLDISRARTELGYDPMLPLSVGIERVGAYYRTHRA